MFSIKYCCGPSDEYYMYSAYMYCVQGWKHDGLRIDIEQCERICISVWPEKGSDPFDVIVDSGQIAYIMNDMGQTIDIIKNRHGMQNDISV